MIFPVLTWNQYEHRVYFRSMTVVQKHEVFLPLYSPL